MRQAALRRKIPHFNHSDINLKLDLGHLCIDSSIDVISKKRGNCFWKTKGLMPLTEAGFNAHSEEDKSSIKGRRDASTVKSTQSTQVRFPEPVCLKPLVTSIPGNLMTTSVLCGYCIHLMHKCRKKTTPPKQNKIKNS